jgi:hydroxyproline O-galactosyltransferase 2/3/4/5/6
MRRTRRNGGLHPLLLLLLLPFTALLSVATVSLRSADRNFVSDRRLSSSHLHRLAISTVDVRALDAAPPLHAAAARAFRSGRRFLRDVLASTSPCSSSAPAPPPDGAARRCPAFVSLSGAQLRSAGGVVLPLPCGLTLGSHVTVVGVPRRVRGAAVLAQFAVELRGEGDGDAAPTILHFNPRLRGDWSGRPVIEQNTRFRGKWGPALRCEGRRSRPDEENGASVPPPLPSLLC